MGQDKFEEAKLDFEFITSHHVYSVQKNKETPSANILYLVNTEKVENDVDVSKQWVFIKILVILINGVYKTYLKEILLN